MKRICTTLLLGFVVFTAKAQFTSTPVTSVTCSPATGNPTSDIVNSQGTLNRIGHAESGAYGTNTTQWSAIGIPNLTTVTPNSCNLYGFAANWDSDRFFCGLKNGDSNRKDAVIGWGDDEGSGTGPDRLIFAFYNTSTHQNDANGFEVATMYPNGNVGIGSSFQAATPPLRKLDVLDNANPQLRLTHTQSTTSPIYTEFQTTSLGDLFINPIGPGFLSLPFPRNVGVGTSTPVTTLHVNGDGMFRGASRDFRLTNTGGIGLQSNSVLFVDQSTVGGWAGIMIKGNNAGSNHPTLGFGLINSVSNTILSSMIAGVPVVNTANSETGDLVFSAKPAAGQVAERLRIVGGTGFVGVNTNAPSQQLDVNGTARLRNIPANTPQVLLTGAGTGSDYVVNRLAFTGSTTQVLLGNGTFGNIPTTTIPANNGVSNSSGTIQLGQATCSATGAAQFTSDRVIPMGDFNLFFNDGSNSTWNKNRIGIGLVACALPAAKVEILRRPMTGLNEPEPTTLKVGNTDVSNDGQYNGTARGIVSEVLGQNRLNLAGNFLADDAVGNIGIRGLGQGRVSGGLNMGGDFYAGENDINIGVAGTAISSGGLVVENVGLKGIANNATGNNYGVYGSTALTSTGADYAGYFNGDIWYTGSVYAPSDERYKNNIQPASDMLERLKQLDVKTYDFINEKGISFPTVNQVGIMAQNLEKVFPNLVKKSLLTSPEAVIDPSLNKEIKAVNYAGLIPVLVEAVKELDAKVTEPNKALEAELADIKAKYNQLNDLINDLCNNGCDIFKTPTTGSIKPASLLFQNIPNPFTKSTVINYSIAEGAQKAEMLLSDMNGQPLQKINLEISKQGTVSIPSDNLTVGTFTYSLIVDGKLIDTKKMMLTGN